MTRLPFTPPPLILLARRQPGGLGAAGPGALPLLPAHLQERHELDGRDAESGLRNGQLQQDPRMQKHVPGSGWFAA